MGVSEEWNYQCRPRKKLTNFSPCSRSASLASSEMFFAQFLKMKDSSRALPLYRRCITKKSPHSQFRVDFCSCKQDTYVV